MMYTEKAYELARDIAREQYTDDPDDPHWWEDEDEDIDEDEDPFVALIHMRQFLLDRGYPLRALATLDDTTLKQWYKDELEEMNQPEEDNRCDYEKHPLDSSYYEDARFM